MTKVLILGANGGIAGYAIDLFLKETDAELTLFLRNAGNLRKLDPYRTRVIEGDVMDMETLEKAMAGQDVVYANLAGNLEKMAKNIVEAMNASGVKRLIFINSMGIYDEVPGEKYGSILNPYRKSAQVIEASNLDYTILRPAWFTNKNEINYETTQKGELFKGSEVSRKSVADLIVKLAVTPGLEVRSSLGVNKPE
ncbi:SDR family oxidoreductase [Paenibacillus odorifer]|uniref:SDR family oxidoreductase n=1 Tax=Paenibacillus TaxID=44249 RepID=UPI00096D8E2E|nr:SDR family oxidoreductase [Paenibacillus odorifer]OMC93831.1 NAD-dependent dehydratase [Paenibacillus odorifer]OZQ79702.1 NAD-dependent dehydratase [Paenibacillus odorifer]